jgi:hypothetical protein
MLSPARERLEAAALDGVSFLLGRFVDLQKRESAVLGW